MGFILKLTDGVDIVDFMDTAYRLQDGGLAMPPPDSKDIWGGQSIYAYGAQLISSTYENREIELEFSVRGSTRDTLLSNISLVDKLVSAAKRRSIEESGRRVEFQYAWDGTDSVTYYEVVTGELSWPDNVMSVEQVHQRLENGDYVIRDFTLTLTVYPYGYPVSPVSGTPATVSITNTHGSGTLLCVDNCGDTSHCNYVEILGSSLIGSFPLITKIEMQSDAGESEKTSKVYIGVRKGDVNFRHILEDSDASYIIDGALPTADVDNSSGGTYTTLTFSGVDIVTLAKWGLSDAEVESTQGAFRVFGRVKDNTFWSVDANYRLAVSYDGVVLHTSEWRIPLETTVTLFDFGTLFLPPWLGSMTDLAGLDIELQAMRKSSGSTSIQIDYMALLPQDGGYRVLQFRGGGLTREEYLVDDGWGQAVYHENLAGKKSGLPFGLMPPIKLEPGTTQRLYFLVEGTAGSTEITRKLNVRIGVVPAYMVLS